MWMTACRHKRHGKQTGPEADGEPRAARPFAEPLGQLHGRRCVMKSLRVRVMVVAASLVLALGGVAHALPVSSGLLGWYDAGDVDGDWQPDALADGSTVSTWVNKANPGTFDGTANSDPAIANGGGDLINGQPVIRFDGQGGANIDAYTVGTMRDGLGGYHVLTVTRSSEDDGANWQRLVSAWDGSASNDYLGEGWNFMRPHMTGPPVAYPTEITQKSEGNKRIRNIHIARNSMNTGNEGFDGDVGEVLLYDHVLSSSERILTENYLAAKYDLVAPTDRYAGDTVGNGDYDLDVLGIGRVAAGNEVTTSASAGLGITAIGGTLGDGEWVLAGHKTPVNAWSHDDVPGELIRSGRVWYIDKTGSVDVDLTFDLSDSGLAPAAGSYSLLYSATNAFAFADLGITPTVSGDEVAFRVLDGQLLDGYYALATTPEPATMALLALGGLGLWRKRRRS